MGADFVIDPAALSVIVTESGDPDFFEAVVKRVDGAIDMPSDELTRWREWVYNGGAPPWIP